MTEKTGKVYLIGAGPGDPGLITVKGRDLLYSCDAVIYDHLVSDELIVAVPLGREMHYVGKKAADHPVPQEKINALMLQLAREGKSVARLKGSDPLIFGRGGEEAKYLKEHGIKFEIVTGVTSGIAGPAYSGIPCTDRQKASFVVFVTGHKSSDKLKTTVPWDWLAKATGGTIVIYMGVREIEKITGQLLEHGMAPETPAAIIERGTFPSQRLVISTIKNLAQAARDNDIKPPALFVIGEVVDLQPWLEWFTDRPLLGKRIMVTRPVDQSFDFYERLRRMGAEPMPFPTIATEAADDPEGWKAFRKISSGSGWLVFTSENGVRYFFDLFHQQIGDIRHLGQFKIAAVGAGTAKALKKQNISVDFIPQKATVKTLAAAMKESLELDGTTVVRIRGNLADDTLENALTDQGAKVSSLTTYNTFHPDWPDGLKDKLLENPPHAFVFTSGSTIDGLWHNLSEEEIRGLTDKADIFSLGPMVSEKLRAKGFTVTAQSEVYTIDGLIKTVRDYYNSP